MLTSTWIGVVWIGRLVTVICVPGLSPSALLLPRPSGAGAVSLPSCRAAVVNVPAPAAGAVADARAGGPGSVCWAKTAPAGNVTRGRIAMAHRLRIGKCKKGVTQRSEERRVGKE